jgi:two-component system, NarL family, sensor histidine kinase ComP
MVLKKEITHQIKNLLNEHPQGLRITDIIKKVNINRNTAGRYLENLLVSGQVEMRRFGMAKIYSLSQRVPLSALLSISSEMVIQLDSSLRIVFVNEPFVLLVGTDSKSLEGKNIEYTPVALVFEDFFSEFIENLRAGGSGKEWIGEIVLRPKDITLFCRIAPTVFDDGRKGVTVILEDITPRKEAEQKVEESERQFRLLAENSLDMISRIKPDGTRIYISPAYKTTLGYEPEELIGKSDDAFIHPRDAHILESTRKILTHENPTAMVTFRTKHKNGHYIWIESAVKAIFDENTRVLSEYYTVTRDISRRKKAEKLLKESEERYRTLVVISPDPVIIHQVGKISYVNPAAIKLLGALYPDEIIGKNILDFIHPDFRDSVMENIEKDLKEEESPSVELQMIRLDGTSIVVEGRGIKTNFNGKPAIQVALRDRTESKHTEKALRESEATARALINAPTDSVLLIDNQGMILALNEIAASRFGKRSNELVGTMSYDLLPKEIAQLRRSLMAPVLEKKEMVRFMDERAGTWYDTVAYPILDETGEVKKIAIIARDITEQKTFEKRLRESEQMYKSLLEHTFDAIAIHKEGNIVFLNDRAAKILGAAKPEDLMGKSIFEFIHPDSRKDLEDRIQKLRGDQGTPVPVITEKFIRTDGSTITVEVLAISFDDKGTPAFRVAFREISPCNVME